MPLPPLRATQGAAEHEQSHHRRERRAAEHEQSRHRRERRTAGMLVAEVSCQYRPADTRLR
eukprot:7380480-Prymnesium_polylepis.1